MVDSLILHWVWKTVFATGLFSMAVLGLILALRLGRRYHAFRRHAFRTQWHPLLSRGVIEDVPGLPPLARRDRYAFLELWVAFQESFTGESRGRLNHLALRLGVDRTALKLSGGSRLSKRLVAMTALGYLRCPEAWDVLHNLIRHANPTLSLVAARALARIDGNRALPLLVPHFASRHDWPLTEVTQVLRETGSDLAALMLGQTALTGSPEQAARLIRLIEAIRGVTALSLVREVLDAHPDDATIVPAALRLLGQCEDPRDLPRLRRYVRHANWIIRLQAAAALGKMGTMEDEDELIALLSDQHWWVRYRAAEGLSRLPQMTRQRLITIRARIDDEAIASVLDPWLGPPVDQVA